MPKSIHPYATTGDDELWRAEAARAELIGLGPLVPRTSRVAVGSTTTPRDEQFVGALEHLETEVEAVRPWRKASPDQVIAFHNAYLEITLTDAASSSDGLLFGDAEPSGGLPADVARVLSAEVRALLYTLMKEGTVSIALGLSAICLGWPHDEASADEVTVRLNVPINVGLSGCQDWRFSGGFPGL